METDAADGNLLTTRIPTAAWKAQNAFHSSHKARRRFHHRIHFFERQRSTLNTLSFGPKDGEHFRPKDSRKYASTGGWGYAQFDDGKPADEALLKICYPCHSGEAEEVGMKMRPTKLLIFGSPQAGTPLMLAAPNIPIDLPLKILFWEDHEGKVWISYNSAEYLRQRHGVPQELLANSAVVETLAAKAADECKSTRFGRSDSRIHFGTSISSRKQAPGETSIAFSSVVRLLHLLRNLVLPRKSGWSRTICTLLVQTRFFLSDRLALQTPEPMEVRW